MKWTLIILGVIELGLIMGLFVSPERVSVSTERIEYSDGYLQKETLIDPRPFVFIAIVLNSIVICVLAWLWVREVPSPLKNLEQQYQKPESDPPTSSR